MSDVVAGGLSTIDEPLADANVRLPSSEQVQGDKTVSLQEQSAQEVEAATNRGAALFLKSAIMPSHALTRRCTVLHTSLGMHVM